MLELIFHISDTSTKFILSVFSDIAVHFSFILGVVVVAKIVSTLIYERSHYNILANVFFKLLFMFTSIDLQRGISSSSTLFSLLSIDSIVGKYIPKYVVVPHCELAIKSHCYWF